MSRRVCVLGAGVIGLSSAVCVQDMLPDVAVTVVADTFTPNTLSDGSAGFWMPFLVDPSDTSILYVLGTYYVILVFVETYYVHTLTVLPMSNWCMSPMALYLK